MAATMSRRRHNLLTLASLLLCVAAVVPWARRARSLRAFEWRGGPQLLCVGYDG